MINKKTIFRNKKQFRGFKIENKFSILCKVMIKKKLKIKYQLIFVIKRRILLMNCGQNLLILKNYQPKF